MERLTTDEARERLAEAYEIRLEAMTPDQLAAEWIAVMGTDAEAVWEGEDASIEVETDEE